MDALDLRVKRLEAAGGNEAVVQMVQMVTGNLEDRIKVLEKILQEGPQPRPTEEEKSIVHKAMVHIRAGSPERSDVIPPPAYRSWP